MQELCAPFFIMDTSSIGMSLLLEDFDGEVWRDVIGYNGLYEISSYGRLKCMPNKGTSFKHLIYDVPITLNGYKYVQLYKSGVYKWIMIHRLVAIAFLDNPENKPFVNHTNSIRHDNYFDNLEWCTQKENIAHGIKYGNKSSLRGELNIKAVLKESQVMDIFKSELPNCLLSEIYFVNLTTIRNIKSGVTWSFLTGKVRVKKKLDDETVLNIFNSSTPIYLLSKELSIKRTTIQAIRTGQNFSQITGKVYNPDKLI